MKKQLLAICLCCLFTLATVITVGARLTPGIDCLATQTELVKTGAPGEDVVFRDADFRQILGVTTYPDVTVETLPDPAAGMLKLGNLRVSAGQTILREQIETLCFTPANQLVTEAKFTFRCGDLCGGSALTCVIRFTERENHAPTANSGETASPVVRTRENISVVGTLSGYDPDGDNLTYLIIAYPKKGTLTVTDPARGDFRYTPTGGFRGRDAFTYVVRDEWGHYSAPATVEIKVEKQTIDLDFADIGEDDPTLGDAQEVTDAGVMAPTINGRAAYFEAGASVPRADFLAMLARAAGITPVQGAHTFFDDDADIPADLRPYVAALAARGVPIGKWQGGKLICDPKSPVTRADAAVWTVSVFRMQESAAPLPFTDADAVPVSARGALGTVYAAGLIRCRANGAIAWDQALTRAEAAALLARCMP